MEIVAETTMYFWMGISLLTGISMGMATSLIISK